MKNFLEHMPTYSRELLKVDVVKQLVHTNTAVRMIRQHLFHDINPVATQLRQHMMQTNRFLLWKLDRDIQVLKLTQHHLTRCTQDIMYVVHLIQLIFTGKHGFLRNHLVKAAPQRPDVHLRSIVSGCQ